MTYDELCTAVGKIDKEAEQYMRTDAKDLKTFQPDNIFEFKEPHKFLRSVFGWEETSQGAHYWLNIHFRLI